MTEKGKNSSLNVSATTAKQLRSICKKAGADEKTFLTDLIDAIYSISSKADSINIEYETNPKESMLKITAKERPKK